MESSPTHAERRAIDWRCRKEGAESREFGAKNSRNLHFAWEFAKQKRKLG